MTSTARHRNAFEEEATYLSIVTRGQQHVRSYVVIRDTGYSRAYLTPEPPADPLRLPMKIYRVHVSRTENVYTSSRSQSIDPPTCERVARTVSDGPRRGPSPALRDGVSVRTRRVSHDTPTEGRGDRPAAARPIADLMALARAAYES
ncbi:hypothetical protein EVAR_53111_1 [Eumeta japonica]|uniref:Uncharacterized protein n=1 Tax=Eumeta variegata TaxID=151549 RepID=A0A4C1Y6V0_EUMVA|nr:hypothetical protein EVAR_53111_1 [Eumeta japonica]